MKSTVIRIESIYGDDYHIRFGFYNDGSVNEETLVINLPADSNQPQKKQLICDAIKAFNPDVLEVVFPDFSISG